MKKKISISTTVTLVLLAMALTISLTMLLAMRHFNNQLQLVSERQEMYSHIDDIDKIVREYYPNLDKEALRQGIAQGYVNGVGDPYAAYYTPQDYVAEKLRLSGKANNVGVTLSLDSEAHVVVSGVAASSAADKAGVKVGDVVVAVDSVPVEGKSYQALQKQMNTAEKVMLTVRRGEGNHAYELSAFEYAVRTVIETKLGTVRHIKISAFYENTPDQFKATVSDILAQEDVTGLIFDLRNNVGGSSAAAQEILSYILPLGAYGTMTDHKGNVTRLSTKAAHQLDLPTVTLINGGTAGEAELFAGVLKEANLTTVMGQTSAGKAKYQQYFVLEQDYSAVKLTAGEYGLMKGGSWEGKGILPAEEVVLPPEQAAIHQLLSPHDDAQVQAAVTKLELTVELPGVGDNTDPIVPGPTTDPTGTDGTATDGTGTDTTAGTTTTAG